MIGPNWYRFLSSDLVEHHSLIGLGWSFGFFFFRKNAYGTRGGAARPPLPTSSPPNVLTLVVLGLGLGSGPLWADVQAKDYSKCVSRIYFANGYAIRGTLSAILTLGRHRPGPPGQYHYTGPIKRYSPP